MGEEELTKLPLRDSNRMIINAGGQAVYRASERLANLDEEIEIAYGSHVGGHAHTAYQRRRLRI